MANTLVSNLLLTKFVVSHFSSVKNKIKAKEKCNHFFHRDKKRTSTKGLFLRRFKKQLIGIFFIDCV